MRPLLAGAATSALLCVLAFLYATGGGVALAFGQPEAPTVWGFVFRGEAYPPPPPTQRGIVAPANDSEAWALDFLARLGNTQPTRATVNYVLAWQQGEGTAAQFNPLATTQPAQGDTCFNYLSGRCGVRNYPDYETGMRATVETITNGFYPNILAGLQTNDPERALNDDELGTWGTGGENVRTIYRRINNA